MLKESQSEPLKNISSTSKAPPSIWLVEVIWLVRKTKAKYQEFQEPPSKFITGRDYLPSEREQNTHPK